MTADALTYELCGLRIRSELPLDEPAVPNDDPDVEVRWGSERKVPSVPPAGRTLAELVIGDTRLYTASENGQGFILRFHETCDFLISRDGRMVEGRPDPDLDPRLIPILLGGTVLAFILTIREHCVLHASAVESGGVAFAFVGESGMGKSTVAALLCAAGASLVSDDLLRVELTDPPVCLRGSSTLRLRPGAASIVEGFRVPPPTGSTPDGRYTVSPPRSRDRVPLAAIVVPHLSQSTPEVTVRRLDPVDAVFTLSRFPRLRVTQANELLARQFSQIASLTDRVPVFEAHIPWGSPLDATLAGQLLAELPVKSRVAASPLDERLVTT